MDSISESRFESEGGKVLFIHQKNRLSLHFLSYFTVEVKVSSAKTYLLMESFAETEQFFFKSVFFTEQFTRSKHFFPPFKIIIQR